MVPVFIVTGLSFLKEGIQTNRWGLACPAHCQGSEWSFWWLCLLQAGSSELFVQFWPLATFTEILLVILQSLGAGSGHSGPGGIRARCKTEGNTAARVLACRRSGLR